ncbi:MAG: hypothetical protein AMJ65_17375 [Phycisphaerae bacterium SG8_4]|nr:MAG: hypothetical protein AMJ65_17375 [Phycisphaerae bacterium SG8_4]
MTLEEWTTNGQPQQDSGRLRERFAQLEQAKRNQTDEEFKRSEEIFGAIFDNAADGMLLADVESKQLHMGNKVICRMLGYSPQEIKNLRVLDIHRDEDLPYVIEQFDRQARGESTLARDIPVKRKDGSVFYADVNSIPITLASREYLLGIFRDITKSKNAEKKQELRLQILETFQRQESLERTCRRIISLLKGHLNCEAVALRMRDGDDYPYYVNNGFSRRFIESENNLCARDEKGNCLMGSDGRPVLACMCGIVINSKFDRAKPFFTEEGSFWTNSTTELLASTTAESRGGATRNTCNKHGYESVALIPVTSNCGNTGLLQINARRRDLFSSERIKFLEEAGRLIGIAIERKKSEEELVKSATYLDTMGEALVVLDAKRKLIRANEAAVRLWGYDTPEEMLNLTCQQLFPEREHEKHYIEMEEAVATGKIRPFETVVFTKDGREVPATACGTAMKDFNGGLPVFVGVFRDITEFKETQEMLAVKEAAIASSMSGIAIADVEGDLTYVNNSFLKMWGYQDENEVLGRNAVEFWQKPDEASEVVKVLRDKGARMTELIALRKDGSTFEVQLSANMVSDENGRPICMMSSFVDVSEFRRREKQLREYREKMVRVERLASIGTVAATMAHKLTQPLTVINMSLESVLKSLDMTSFPEPVARKRLEESLKQVSNITAITDRFRNFARKSSKPIVREIDLKVVAERIVGYLSESARRAGIALRIKDLEDLPPVYWDMNDFEQLFFSLVDNAVRAASGKDNEQLVISGVVKDGHIELQFSDNCGGIAPEDLDKVFEPFFTTRPVGQGTGLGLSIVQEIVSRARGKVRVESKFGEGSTFFITLPVDGNRMS